MKLDSASFDVSFFDLELVGKSWLKWNFNKTKEKN